MKQTCYPPFWGVVGDKKWSPFFCYSIRNTIFWHLKAGTFAESARFQVPKNGISDHVTKKRRPLFVANYPPKWWITCLFHALITFGWVLSQFLIWVILCSYWVGFPATWAKKPTKSAALQQRPLSSWLLIYQVRCNFSYIAWESDEVYHVLPQVQKLNLIILLEKVQLK